LPNHSSGQPEGRSGHLDPFYLALLRAGFAQQSRLRLPGALLPHHFTLIRPSLGGRCSFCGTFRRVTPPGSYPAPCPEGVRTFLIRPRKRSRTRPLSPLCGYIIQVWERGSKVASPLGSSQCRKSEKAGERDKCSTWNIVDNWRYVELPGGEYTQFAEVRSRSGLLSGLYPLLTHIGLDQAASPAARTSICFFRLTISCPVVPSRHARFSPGSWASP